MCLFELGTQWPSPLPPTPPSLPPSLATQHTQRENLKILIACFDTKWRCKANVDADVGDVDANDDDAADDDDDDEACQSR